jgi:hypothetical protein
MAVRETVCSCVRAALILLGVVSLGLGSTACRRPRVAPPTQVHPWQAKNPQCPAISERVAYCCSCPPEDERFAKRLQALQFNEQARAVVQDCLSHEISRQGPLSSQPADQSLVTSQGVRDCATRRIELDKDMQQTIQQIVLELSHQPPDPTWQACNERVQSTGTCPLLEQEQRQTEQERRIAAEESEESRRRKKAEADRALAEWQAARARQQQDDYESYYGGEDEQDVHRHYCCDSYGHAACEVSTYVQAGAPCECPHPSHLSGLVCH